MYEEYLFFKFYIKYLEVIKKYYRNYPTKKYFFFIRIIYRINKIENYYRMLTMEKFFCNIFGTIVIKEY